MRPTWGQKERLLLEGVELGFRDSCGQLQNGGGDLHQAVPGGLGSRVAGPKVGQEGGLLTVVVEAEVQDALWDVDGVILSQVAQHQLVHIPGVLIHHAKHHLACSDNTDHHECELERRLPSATGMA